MHITAIILRFLVKSVIQVNFVRRTIIKIWRIFIYKKIFVNNKEYYIYTVRI
jgi:hypothetical protein